MLSLAVMWRSKLSVSLDFGSAGVEELFAICFIIKADSVAL